LENVHVPNGSLFVVIIYHLLTEFEGRTVSYEATFSTSIHSQSAKRRGKRGSVIYSTDRENEVGKIFITSQLCV